MQLLWYLPSLLTGLGIGFFTGNWLAAALSGSTALLVLAVQLVRGRYPEFSEIDEVVISAAGVAISNRVLPRWQLFWKPGWNELILRQLDVQDSSNQLETTILEIRDHGFSIPERQELPLWLGIAQDGQRVVDLAVEGPHAIIVGPTGSGKSELIKLMVRCLIQQGRTQLALFDFKGGASLGEFFEGSFGFATDLDHKAQSRLWDALRNELSTRESMFAYRGLSSIEQHNSGGEKLQRIVVVIDEFAAALASAALAASTIEDICARGRSLGIHLIAASQSLSGIPRAMLTNLRLRIAMNSADPVDQVQLGLRSIQQSSSPLAGFAQATAVFSDLTTQRFSFPLGLRPRLLPVGDEALSVSGPPSRSQLLRQMYLDQAPEQNPAAVPASNQQPRLHERMARLRS